MELLSSFTNEDRIDLADSRRVGGPRMARVWAMPSADTFDIPPIGATVRRYLRAARVSVDPFARNKRWATHTNDLNPDTAAEHHLEAADFLARLVQDGIRADLALFDPPYSPRQTKEVYSGIGRRMMQEDVWLTHGWTRERDILDRLMPQDGIVISCGWNSQGMGKGRGYALTELLIVCHGGGHNDTLVTVERKLADQLPLPLGADFGFDFAPNEEGESDTELNTELE
jgi:hypothetical protein